MKNLCAILIISTIILSLCACRFEITGQNSSQASGSSESSSQASQAPQNQPIWKMENFDPAKANTNIYYFRNDRILKFNREKDTFEYFAAIPSEKACHIAIDRQEKFMYYSYAEEETDDGYILKSSFRKLNLHTKEETVIDPDLLAMGPFIYDKKIYFWSDGYIMHYDTQKNTFKIYLSTCNIDGNGFLEVYDGSVYFYSCKLHRISLNDMGTEVFADNNTSYSYGKFYKNHLYYFYFEEDNRRKLIKQDIETGEKTTLDEYTAQVPEDEFESLPYLFISDDIIYCSYNNETYKLGTNGQGKEKIADFPIRGEIFMNNNKLYWIYGEGQDDGIGGPLEWSDYKLYSYDLLTKERTELPY